MKKYFAKFLPVEGEIKERDWVLNPEKPLQRAYFAYQDNPPGMKKAQFFLCSRDIQVGNNVYYNDPYNQDTDMSGFYTVDRIDDLALTIDNVVTIQGDSYSTGALSSNLIRVIAPISPQAVWVKEGDEFDEDEVKLCCNIGTKEKPNYVNWIEGREELGYKCTVLIKCPHCEKF